MVDGSGELHREQDKANEDDEADVQTHHEQV